MKNENKSTKRLTVLLAICVVSLGLLSLHNYKSSRERSELEEILSQEKQNLQAELDEIIGDYTDIVVRKKNLSKRLRRELRKIVELRDSVKSLQRTNYASILQLRKRIVTLERENKLLFMQVDSLTKQNYELLQENCVAKKELDEKELFTEELTQKNIHLNRSRKRLAAKVAVASLVKSGPLKVLTLKERSSGKLSATSRSSKTDAFKVFFDLLENSLAKKGNKAIYIQIVGPNKKIIAGKGKIKLKNGTRITFSDAITVNYIRERMRIVSLILVNRADIIEGDYRINTFVDGVYTGKATVSLK